VDSDPLQSRLERSRRQDQRQGRVDLPSRLVQDDPHEQLAAHRGADPGPDAQGQAEGVRHKLWQQWRLAVPGEGHPSWPARLGHRQLRHSGHGDCCAQAGRRSHRHGQHHGLGLVMRPGPRLGQAPHRHRPAPQPCLGQARPAPDADDRHPRDAAWPGVQR